MNTKLIGLLVTSLAFVACGGDPTASEPTACSDGFVRDGDSCVAADCVDDTDCSDGNVCNGQEHCSQGACAAGEPIVCGSHERCAEGTCVCDPGYEKVAGTCEAAACGVPQAPTLSIIHEGATLTWSVPGGNALEIGTSKDPTASAPVAWTSGDTLQIAEPDLPSILRVFARAADPKCAASVFAFTYEVRDVYPASAGQAESTAVPKDDPRIVAWATGWVDPVGWGTDVDDEWKHPERALGPAEGTSTDIVSLGEGGSIVLELDPPIGNGRGADFAVFENGFNDEFLELAYVEVSSNGVDFVRFDSAYLGEQPLGAYGVQSTTLIGSLAGKYRQGFGTPFDLEVFVNRPEVASGLVDLGAIRFVRVVDIVGDGSALDSFGNVIWDPYPTTGSAGFDLDAIAVLGSN